MVRLGAFLLCRAAGAAPRRRQPGGQKWLDTLRIYCKAGNGGNGAPKVGGFGGRGGDVAIEVDQQAKDLYTIFKKTFNGDPKQQRLTGGSGGHAAKTQLLGLAGGDGKLKVPPGITVSDDDGRIILDLDGERVTKVIVAEGGAGGNLANNWFGQPGEKVHVRLDMKLIADIGLVGFPNAGKSTLLKAISRARPKIASYPFTTIKPNLGQLVYDDFREITMADLPGLIEGAHYNVGMGHKFLKHVERTRMLLFVVDIQGFQLSAGSVRRSAFETIALLNRELELYKEELLDKPAVCLINKMDTDGAKSSLAALEAALGNYADSVAEMPDDLRPRTLVDFREVIPMSAKFSRKTVTHVKQRLRQLLDDFDLESRQPQNLPAALRDELAVQLRTNSDGAVV